MNLSQKKNLRSWLLYDLGNSFVAIVLGGLYLSQYIIVDNKMADIRYSGMFALSTIFVLLVSPFMGAWSDNIGKRLPFLKITTMLIIGFGLILGIVMLTPLAEHKIYFVLFLGIVLLFLYQLSQMFYNSMLEAISTKQTRGKYSGLGEFFNNLGRLIAAGVMLVFASSKFHLFGNTGREQVFLPAFIIFSIISIPMLTLFKETTGISKKIRYTQIYSRMITGIKRLFKENKNIGIFLIGFSLISDAILTAEMYFAVVLDKIYQVSDTQKTIILSVMLIVSMIFCYIWGRIGDRIKHKNVILISTIATIIIMGIFYLFTSRIILYLLPIITGIGRGGYYVSSRALLIKISPEENLGEYFGLYSTFQKFASVIGPIIWGLTTLLLVNYGLLKYRVAGLILVAFMIFGLLFIYKVKE